MVPVERLIELEQRLQTLESQQRQQRVRRRRLVLAVAVLVALGAPLAWAAGNCRSGLICFQKNSPAVADDVNQNFWQLATWLDAKLGPIDSAGIVVDGGTTLNGTTTINGATALTSTLTLAGNLTMANSTAQVQLMNMNWCDCEEAQQLDNNGNISNIGNNFLFESTTGMFECRSGRFLVGIRTITSVAGGCDGIHCLENYKCCRACVFVKQGPISN